ncbi:MAG TPA: transglutaminaseTgpA domain-containing protein, partial [Methylomirabilota bacterium]|nr:transglutaminaseTgpA domain-containing protein [Methylomirabilota bacterium]
MTPPALLRLALYLLVADGLAALYLGDLLASPTAGLVGLALAGSVGADRLRARLRPRPFLGRLLMPLVAAASALDILVLAASVLDGLVRLLLFLVVYKLWTVRTVRETRTVGFLAFFMLVAASASAFGVGFLFVFVAFVVLATWVTLYQQMLLEAEPGPDRVVVAPDGPAEWGWPLFGLAVAAALAAIVITAVLFFVIPRIGLAALPFRARVGPMVTGFSDRVELGAYGEIETDSTVVMRIHVPQWPDAAPDPERLPDLRWRGVVLDAFDGRTWSIRQPRRIWPRRVIGGDVPISLPRGTGRILVHEVYLEPIGTDVIFVAPRPLRLRVRAGEVTLDDMGSIAVPSATARLHYVAASELDEGLGGRPWARPAAPLDDEARYLQLPPLAPRVGALAREVAAGSRDAQEAARRLTAFLSRSYRYTLALERQTALDPVEEFLFVRRSGNCEYFAAALAVMLRSLGIPARVVNGFQRGEWNPYGRYFMVRLRDAHSWVEAYVERAGWVTLDPSPRGAVDAAGAIGPVGLYLDALRMRWQRYVIDWSLRDQMEAALAVRRHASSGLGPWLGAARAFGEG